jgi:tetratricopeptide (TPR) repeat protein
MRTLAVAAAIVVAVLGGWWLFLRHPDPQQLADTYIRQSLLTMDTKMGGVQDSLQLAKNKYNDNDLPGALRLFDEIGQQNPKNSDAIISAGIVCLRLKDYDKALHYFQQLAADTALYLNPALFYQSLTLMKRHLPGDDKLARQLLQEVVDRNLAEKTQAQQWLNKW